MASVRAATAAAVVCIAVLLAMLGSGAGEVRRFAVGEPATVASPAAAWQYDAIGLDRVPLEVVAKASPVTVAVVDTGADVSASDFAGRSVSTFSVLKPGAASDANGHGTFVASIVARTAPNARLLVIGAAAADGSMRDEDEAAAIRYAVRHGARVINLSVAGTSTSTVERRALADAARRGVLVVAAAGNDYAGGNPVEYPAALLQPVGSRGAGGTGLVVGATDASGARAAFSGAGSWLSLAAPGVGILGALAPTAAGAADARTTASVGIASGTSYAAPQVAGAAALLFGVNPKLTARHVAAILKRTASGHGTWTPETGFGTIDIAAAVAAAAGP